MFLGTFFHNLDEKGRIAIPRKFRDTLASLQGDSVTSDIEVIVTRAYDRSDSWLDIFPISAWKDLDGKLRALDGFDKRVKRFKRLYVHPAQQLRLDRQGRIVIPPDLRAEIGLDPDGAKEAVFTGDSEKFLLWSQERWQQTREDDVAASDASDDCAGLLSR